MKIIVSSLQDVPTLVRMARPSHLISLLDPDAMIDTPRGIAAERHLKVGVNDIWEPAEGLIHPTAETVEEILRFGRGWEPFEPMLVHCWAGISRSSATAYILACERAPEASEQEIAERLRRASTAASPNPLMVQLADDMLSRGGRMVDAVRRMGPGTYTWPNPPYELAVDFR
jgi:predicted protein tyrosine phosphatase